MSTKVVDFIAGDLGDVIVFRSDSVGAILTVDNVSLREIETDGVPVIHTVKEFLSGTTDDGHPIFFRADSQSLALNADFEKFSNPIAIVSKTQRGSMLKCFVVLDDDDEFYEIRGTVKKGVSVLKVESQDRKNIISPPIAREIKISWRDSSKQLCRLTQAAIIFIQGNMEIIE